MSAEGPGQEPVVRGQEIAGPPTDQNRHVQSLDQLAGRLGRTGEADTPAEDEHRPLGFGQQGEHPVELCIVRRRQACPLGLRRGKADKVVDLDHTPLQIIRDIDQNRAGPGRLGDMDRLFELVADLHRILELGRELGGLARSSE